jgi:two-component system, cell cycle response regulator DivK
MATILFVDDDPLTLEMLSKSVQLFGHEAILASSGKQALTLVATCSPDLIMTDMSLPDMDGLTLVRRLQQDATTKDIAVVVLSASAEMDIAELVRAAGAKDFLPKPVRLNTLQEVIQRYTGG